VRTLSSPTKNIIGTVAISVSFSTPQSGNNYRVSPREGFRTPSHLLSFSVHSGLRRGGGEVDYSGTVNREEAFAEVWRQALVEGATRVELGDSSFRVVTTPRMRLKQIDFTFDRRDYRGLEQNPVTKSRWAKLAREGKKVMQFLEGGRYIAVVVDGNCKPYPRGRTKSLTD
jgi:hypothetical protein